METDINEGSHDVFVKCKDGSGLGVDADIRKHSDYLHRRVFNGAWIKLVLAFDSLPITELQYIICNASRRHKNKQEVVCTT